jgi:toxin YoeB
VSVNFSSSGWEDYCSWADDRKMLRRINRLIDEAHRDPAAGIGKPEPLTQNLSGFWSRRITDQHRLIYQRRGDDLVIIQARYQY